MLLFLVDDLGKEWISAYGAEDISTPHIDALVRSGLSFKNVYSMPQCTPTRVTLLTGQYPFRHGWVNHWDVPRWGGQAHFDETLNPSLGMEMKKALQSRASPRTLLSSSRQSKIVHWQRNP